MKTLLILLAGLLHLSKAHASLVYVPDRFDPTAARLVVAIHGCLQSSESMALGTGWNVLAEQHNLVIIYPQVAPGTHPQDCWRYWLPENQRRGSGDLGKLHQEIQDWKYALGIPNSHVYLNGISSGAAMVAALLACYPEDFAAGVLHSGLSYALATSEKDALKVQAKGPSASTVREKPCNPLDFRGRVMVIRGTKDRVIHADHAERIIHDFIGPSLETTTVAKKDNGAKYETTDFVVSGEVLRGRLVKVNGLAHAWSGSNLDLRQPKAQRPWSLAALPARLMNHGEYSTITVPFFSTKGPSATHLAYNFFEETECAPLLNDPS